MLALTRLSAPVRRIGLGLATTALALTNIASQIHAAEVPGAAELDDPDAGHPSVLVQAKPTGAPGDIQVQMREKIEEGADDPVPVHRCARDRSR